MQTRVMVVEDAESIRTSTVKILQENNYVDVTQARDGFEALDMIANLPLKPDLVITDLHMPRCDGLELIRKLCATKFSGGVIVVSGLDDRVLKLAMELTECSTVRLLGVLSKPFSIEQLQTCLLGVVSTNDQNYGDKNLLSKEAVEECLAEGRVLPYFQPKVSLRTNQVVGFEALARLVDRQKKIRMPSVFLPTVERYQLDKMLTMALLKNSLPEFKRLQKSVTKPLILSVNISAKELLDNEYPQFLNEFCCHLDLAPEQLTIEITEKEILSSYEQLETLGRLRIHGFGVALDDFGTGFTNFGQLKNLPFTELKLDGQLISGIQNKIENQIVVEAVCKLARLKHFKVTAEGVETSEEWNYLAKKFSRCDVQGFLVSRPKECNEILRWLKAWSHTNPVH